jgi:site-specific recombinase XerD
VSGAGRCDPPERTPAGQGRRRRARDHTFGEACEAWLDYVAHEKDRRPSTTNDYRNAVRRILITEFGAETLPHTIDTERVESFRERMLADGQLSRRPIQKILVLLHGILKRAKRKGWIVANPAVARADGSEYVHHVPQTDAASRLSALLERGEAASASSLR